MPDRSRNWYFLSNHSRVLHCLARQPDSRLRDIAERIGITERATHGILKDLETAGYVYVNKVGRRNHYKVRLEPPSFRHPLDEEHRSELLCLFLGLELPGLATAVAPVES